jgi:hypothetical protein
VLECVPKFTSKEEDGNGKIGRSTKDKQQQQGKKRGDGEMEMGVGKKDSKTHKDVVILLWFFLGPK